MQALFILFLITSTQVLWAESSKEKNLVRIVQLSGLQQKKLGLVIADEHGQIILGVNEDKQFIPASLTKIITAAAVLDKLPVGHQFITSVLAESKHVKNSKLTGDLYLRGGGDAGFVSESMWFLVNEFKRTGITEISGDLIVDDTRFDDVRFDLSRDQDRVDRAYDAPIGAMTLNWSAVNVFVRPGISVGASARVFADPDSSYISLVNKAKTVSGNKTKIEVSNLGFNSKTGVEEIMVSGSIGVAANEFVSYKSITKPEIWAGEQFKGFLQQRGIQLSGKVQRGTVPKSASVLASNKSKPVSDMVYSMMKFSNNYIAEILTKNLGAEIVGVPGTMEKGIQVLRSYLKENGMSDAEIYNPSGLSRKNKFKPNDFVKILLKIKNNFRVYPEFLSSLPIAGVDGTLKRRFGNEGISGHVRAKTGHLSGVSGLSGFASSDSGQIFSFVFLYNGGVDEAYKAKDLFDKLILEVLKP